MTSIDFITEGRSTSQLGKKGKSNYRWIVGGKLCLALNHLGLGLRYCQCQRHPLPALGPEVPRPDGHFGGPRFSC
jgi:hypothetical protein